MRPELVAVHPLVLLSVVDHFKRMSLAPGKRVVGVLLGHWNGNVVNVTNSYASTCHREWVDLIMIFFSTI